MTHNNSHIVKLRYVYIIEVDNRGEKSRYYGKKQIFYTGQTHDIINRLKQHLAGINSIFLKKNFPNSRKIIVYVNQIFANEYVAMGEEYKIKRMNKEQKLRLIHSDKNDLIRYIPFKALILKKFNTEDEQIALYF